MTKGKVVGVNGNMVTVEVDGDISMNEVAYVACGGKKLKAETIRIHGRRAEMQVFEMSRGIGIGDEVEFTADLLSVRLGPGLLAQIYDGLQNPLPELAAQCGFFLERGVYLSPLDEKKEWPFTPLAGAGDKVMAADTLGTVPEGIFRHRIMVPFFLSGAYKVVHIAAAGNYRINDRIAELEDDKGVRLPVTMSFRWPVKRPITCYRERLRPKEPMVTKIRIIDTFIPVARGGTYCIPGPFGAGKTVLQQVTSRNAEIDIVIIAACGERAGEVVETLKEIPGEEAFPAYLESVIAGFYERAGLVRLRDNGTGSVTIGGTVSPAGGNFDEPVTKSTLKVVGAFHGLSRERSDARKYPAIHPLESWSKYPGLIDAAGTEYARDILFRGNEVNQMMKVVGEEGTSLEDYELFLKGDFIDSVYLQQDSYDPVDAAVSTERQRHVFRLLFSVLVSRFDFGGKEAARGFFNQLRQKFLDFNGAAWQSAEFTRLEGEIAALLKARQTGTDEAGGKIQRTLATENKGNPA